jgi:hypothetical protein
VEAENADEAEDDFFTPEMLAEYDQMADDYYAGKLKTTTLRSHEDIDKFFESL